MLQACIWQAFAQSFAHISSLPKRRGCLLGILGYMSVIPGVTNISKKDADTIASYLVFTLTEKIKHITLVSFLTQAIYVDVRFPQPVAFFRSLK